MSFVFGYDKEKNASYVQQRVHIKRRGSIVCLRNIISEDGVYRIEYTGTIVSFEIPFSGIYKIEAWGASGSSRSPTTGPRGAYSKSFVELKAQDKLKIIVGEKGYYSTVSSSNQCCGGGGGSFIAKDDAPLCVAGGGGGSAVSDASSTVSHGCGQATQTGGNPGTGAASLKQGGKASTYGAGGGGFEGNGADNTGGNSNYGKGGNSFINGGSRQEKWASYMVHMGDLVEEVQALGILDGQQEAGDIQEGALQTIMINKVVAAVHILKESLKMKKHLRYQDVARICRQIQVEMEMDTSS